MISIGEEGYIIAEIAQAHDGSLGTCFAYAKSAKKIGCNAIKFQLHIAEEESLPSEKFRVKNFPQDNSRFEYWERTSFTFDEWKSLRDYCHELGINFILSPFSEEALNWCIKLKVNAIKIGSGEVSNQLFLKKVANKLDTRIPIFLSSGMSNYKELGNAFEILSQKNRLVYPMQCTSKYPTVPKDWGLENIQIMKNKYRTKIGFSDHSGEIFAPLAAVTLGAEIIETHLVFHKECFGPDTSSSLSLEDMKKLVDGIRLIKESMSYSYNKDIYNEEILDMKRLFEKKIVARKNIKKDEKFNSDNITAKKGCKTGINAQYSFQIIGKKAKRDYSKNEPIDG